MIGMWEGGGFCERGRSINAQSVRTSPGWKDMAREDLSRMTMNTTQYIYYIKYESFIENDNELSQ